MERRGPLMMFQVPASAIHMQPITITPLSAGASQIILVRGRIKYGMKPPETETLAAQVKAVEAQFPGELVETTLAEVELALGHGQAAKDAAERALKTNPQSAEGLVLRGRSLSELADATEGDGRHAMFEEARRNLIAANKLDTEDPEPLYGFYRSFIREGVRPTANALPALHYASDLAPQDLGVRMNSAIAYLNEGKSREARATLTVVAYSPHVAQMGEVAKRMIAAIDAGQPRAALAELRRPVPSASAN